MNYLTGILLMVLGLLLWERMEKFNTKSKPAPSKTTTVGNLEVKITANTEDFKKEIAECINITERLNHIRAIR